MAAFIGIDLGTTFSGVATIDEAGRPSMVPNEEGRNITPSCVTLVGDDVVEVGEYASRTWGNAPDRAAARFKRDMGTSARYKISGREFTPTELSTFVLKKLKQYAEGAVGPIGEAVVTIPANFAHEAREATLAAARAAGLNVNYIINEPTAAALYYAVKSGQSLAGNYAVYDLGGGTFDISLIRVNGQNIDVLASNGVSKLGGDDFDQALQIIVAKKFKQETGRDLALDDFTKNEAEEEKKSLSQRNRTTVRVVKKLIDVTREEFEEAISSKVAQAELLCESALEEAGLQPADIKGVFLSGGSTRIPMVQESVRRVFKQEPISTVNVDEVVALGAALYAAYKGDRSKLSSVQRRAVDKIKVAESTSKYFGTIALVDDQVRGEERISNSILIRKGEKIPCSVTNSYYTVHDNQDGVVCRVTESSAPESDPRFVKVIWEGRLELPSGRAKHQEIKVTFAYDANQTMKCAFVDVATGRRTQIDLSMASGEGTLGSEIDKFLVE